MLTKITDNYFIDLDDLQIVYVDEYDSYIKLKTDDFNHTIDHATAQVLKARLDRIQLEPSNGHKAKL